MTEALGGLTKQGFDGRHHRSGAILGGDPRGELPGVLAQLWLAGGDAHCIGHAINIESALRDGARAYS